MAPDNKRIAQALLRTMSADAPSARAREKTLAAFGVVSGVTAVATSATASAIGTSGGAASSLTIGGSLPASTAAGVAPAGTALVAGKAAASGIALSITKALFVGALAGGAAVYAGTQVRTPGRAQPRAETAPIHASKISRENAPKSRIFDPAIGPTEPATDVPPPAPLEEVEKNDLPNSPLVTRAAPPAGSRDFTVKAAPLPAASATPTPIVSAISEVNVDDAPKPGLADEIQRLDRARFALRSGAAPRALHELETYEAAFPGGILLPEATVLHVEVLMQLGDETGARALGSAFVSAHPTSGHVPKILRSLSKRFP